ncbi:polyketide cyclase [Taibaiella sp. KBW10]|uniref:SRPBCC family protein n=1 Tax=Taibaiella sp. KBW10 TaxID=2153357 RepID=UPI000F5B7478|nr:SRPBCC family protein [Taibaiella sp. KBW10]RQO30784.1 polyketide cyclase [Taibaiella sp. KBW10]
MENPIKVQTSIHAPVDTVWDAFNDPEAVKHWNSAAPDWHCPKASNDLSLGGRFNYTMAARDGSMEFDFTGTYTDIEEHKRIGYTLGDGRKVRLQFEQEGDHTLVTELFEAEQQNPRELQEGGWQAILDNFKKHVEAK